MPPEIQRDDLQPIELSLEGSRRPPNPGAEKWLGVPIQVLDHGFVYLVDYMGNDESIEQAARVSYGSGTRKVSETTGLIRYLLRHHHTTPFEMVEMKFHAKMPLFVARQWIRHRTANVNEYSARYSILDNEFYLPEPSVIAVQSKANRQGRDEPVDPSIAEEFRQTLFQDAMQAYNHYESYLNDDGNGKPKDTNRPMVARELARVGLPTNFYTQWYWKVDLHNLFHFLGLRMDEHAQWEIRQYANAMSEIVKDSMPMAWEAFEDYELYAKQLSRPEQRVMTELFRQKGINFTEEEILLAAAETGLTNRGEKAELLNKFKALKITKK